MKRFELNPVLVKEVRQALRGRYFRRSFALTLGLTTVVAIVTVIATGVHEGNLPMARGLALFSAVSSAIALGTIGLVPFSAFAAMSAESEDNTLDLLLLSNLKPRQIVLGKLLSAAVQALLYYSALVPFLMFAFLLQGVDPGLMLGSFAVSMLACLAFSSLGIALSVLATTRWLRVVLMMLFGFVLFFYVLQGHVVAVFMLSMGVGAGAIGSSSAFAWGAIGYTALLALCIVFACVRLAHAEENRSTPLRIVCALLAVLTIPIGFAIRPADWSRAELALFFAEMLAFSLPITFFVTEPERLGLRVRRDVPRRRWLALLATPFLPGGGRGVLFALGTLTTLVAGWFVACGGFPGLPTNPSFAAAIVTVYVVGYVLVPSALLAKGSDNPRRRVIARVLCMTLGFVVWLGLALAGSVAEFDSTHVASVASPLRTAQTLRSYGLRRPALLLFIGIVLLGVAVNLPRMWRGVREVLEASAQARRAHVASNDRKAAHAVADA